MKIKKYIECYVPIETCNLRCHYCYIVRNNKFNNKVTNFEYDAKYIRQSLSKERLGGVCLLNLCAGGETLISNQVIDVLYEFLEEGHYVSLVTNGILTKQFEKISKFPKELLNRLFFKFSFHYLELIRIGKLEVFFNNIEMMKQVGCSYMVEITPNDELIPHIEDIKKISVEKLGILPHITVAREDKDEIPMLTKLSAEEYKRTWGVFQSELFDFKLSIFGKKRKEFCYAGDWFYYLNLATGDLRQCYCGMKIQNIYKDIKKPIKKLAIGNNCPEPHCYNGHAFLTLGLIPELETPNYASLRNRVYYNGEEWLTQQMKDCMSCKLKDNNREYTEVQKKCVNFKNKNLNKLRKIKNIVKK